MDFMEVGVLVQLLLAIAQIVVALVMWLSVREIRRDRKYGFLEKRLKEFYIPLIILFSRGWITRGPSRLDKVERIIESKRYLCGKRVAEILPDRFPAMVRVIKEPDWYDYYFYFGSEYEKKRWESIADIIWSEYIEVLKEYYDIIGVKQYVLPEKPTKWMFNVIKSEKP
jgi:hypothetical protein